VDFQDVVVKRRMVRSFEAKPLPAGAAQRIVDNARRGPSAGFAQGIEFLVLEGPEETGRYWDAELPEPYRKDFAWPHLLDAPLLVVVLSHKLTYLRRYAEPDKGWTDMDEARWPVPYWHVDAGMAALLALLSAVDLGLGACFFSVYDVPGFRRAFAVPDEYTPVGTVAAGYPRADDRPSLSTRRGRRPRAEVVHRGAW